MTVHWRNHLIAPVPLYWMDTLWSRMYARGWTNIWAPVTMSPCFGNVYKHSGDNKSPLWHCFGICKHKNGNNFHTDSQQKKEKLHAFYWCALPCMSWFWDFRVRVLTPDCCNMSVLCSTQFRWAMSGICRFLKKTDDKTPLKWRNVT